MAQIISIFGPKGGVGKTFIATNLAAAFAQKPNIKKVLLLDMDLELPGDSSALLDLRPKKSLIELCEDVKKGSYASTQLQEYILHHEISNLDFTPFVLNRADRVHIQIDEKFLYSILDDLNKMYDYIIADCGWGYSKLLFSFFGQSNLIMIVVNPDLLSVYKAKEAINMLQTFFFPINMIKVILNRSESLGGVGWQEVMAALPSEIITRIPSEGRTVGSALNRRIPVVIDNKHSRVSIAFDKLIGILLSHPEYFITTKELEKFHTVLAPTKEGEFAATDQISVKADMSPNAEEEVVVNKEEEFVKLKQRIHKRIIGELELKRLYTIGTDLSKDKELRQRCMVAISNAMADETGVLISSTEERQRIIKEITDEVLGLGPLEDLINNPDITDIMVNNKDHIYVEKNGKVEFTTKAFFSDEQIRRVIERIIAPLGRRVDESVPMVDARLPDGSRVNAIISPLSLSGPTLTIRKFFRERLTIEDLTKLGTLTHDMGVFIKTCVLARKNIIVSGGTGSGKTTMLNLLSEFIPDDERIITIEDAAELKLHHQHWIRLESRAPNIEGKGAITLRELFRNSLRMRPDRIIIGECRGVESLDMLQSMNTGHDGSMTTLHANSTQDAVARLDSMILMSGMEIPLRAIREMIASAIHLIIHTARLSDGSRKIMQITEVTGMRDDMHIGLRDIFMFKHTGMAEGGKILGNFEPTGTVPAFFDELRARGIPLAKELFEKKAS